jgi:large subunit ribosomal protein L6
MSRIAKAPIAVPAGVEVTLAGQEIKVKGKNGELTRVVNDAVGCFKRQCYHYCST